jgi:uncharacterized membrane protein YdfJ with MMPL/SSD domain
MATPPQPSAAVHERLARTGRVIGAAAVMVVVFGSFGVRDESVFKPFGIAMATAAFLDAPLIRALPVVLRLLGRATRAFPAWLDRRLPRLALESGAPAAALVHALEGPSAHALDSR